MKKYLVILLTAMLAASLTSCVLYENEHTEYVQPPTVNNDIIVEGWTEQSTEPDDVGY